MRALITGGAGFVGSHLAEELSRRGASVIVVDNFLTSTPQNLSNLNGSCTLIEHDVSSLLDVPGPLDAVFHFASPASPRDYMYHPLETLDAGTLGTRRMLDLAQAKNARFMLASTSEVYGDPLVHPQHEEYWGNVNPIGPRSVYDEAKRCAEAYTMAYHRAGLETRIVRIFNTYGPRMRARDGRAIPNFFAQAVSGEQITVYGDGSQTRSLCYVDDLVEGILRLLDAPEHRPVNLGNPEEISMLQLAQVIAQMAGANTDRIAFQPLPEDDPQRRCPDISRAIETLGWYPRTSLEEGLTKTLAWVRGGASPLTPAT